jgi:hypothetical protein
MASDNQIVANRENARHSTGPKTPDGKAHSARNATRHGLLSREAVQSRGSPPSPSATSSQSDATSQNAVCGRRHRICR